MSMFSAICAEHDRSIVAKAIENAVRTMQPKCTVGEFSLILEAMNLIQEYCDYLISNPSQTAVHGQTCRKCKQEIATNNDHAEGCPAR